MHGSAAPLRRPATSAPSSATRPCRSDRGFEPCRATLRTPKSAVIEHLPIGCGTTKSSRLVGHNETVRDGEIR
jgi:hypothetical protein